MNWSHCCGRPTEDWSKDFARRPGERSDSVKAVLGCLLQGRPPVPVEGHTHGGEGGIASSVDSRIVYERLAVEGGCAMSCATTLEQTPSRVARIKWAVN